MPPYDTDEFNSVAEANRVAPFTLRGPTALPDGYTLQQVKIVYPEVTIIDPPEEGVEGTSHEELRERGMNVWMVYVSDSDVYSDYLLITASVDEHPLVPGYPYEGYEAVPVNECQGIYKKSDEQYPTTLCDAEIDRSDSTDDCAGGEQHDGILQFNDGLGTAYYLDGPFTREELIQIAESIE